MDKSPLVSIVVVNWNGAAWLEKCLRSVRSQTYKNWRCLLIDNASTDGSPELGQKILPDLFITINQENRGFAYAANQGIAQSQGEFVLLLNPDVVLMNDYLEILVRYAVTENSVGSFGGKLLRLPTADKSASLIDSAGLTILRNKRRPLDRGEGEADNGQYDKTEYVMGINGAAVLYRRTMLEEVKQEGEYFDSDFYIYYEDVDLAWRALLFGWKSLYIPQAYAYHARGGTQKTKRFAVRMHAAKNRYLVFLKNEPSPVFICSLPLILIVEIFRLISYVFREPVSLLGFFCFLTVIPKFLKKRWKIQASAVIKPEEFYSWYSP